MGGEPVPSSLSVISTFGLSPRGRGTRAGAMQSVTYLRSIPAWAGNPYIETRCHIAPWVYPRVGGEPMAVWRFWPVSCGLSPRGRGTPPNLLPSLFQSAVYPRVGGEPAGLLALPAVGPGLSPRGRGTQPLDRAGRFNYRSIPAWAGNPPAVISWPWDVKVYPRVGGEPN